MQKFIDKIYKAHTACPKCPSRKIIHDFLEELLGFLFPEYAPKSLLKRTEVEEKYEKIKEDFASLLLLNPQLHNQDVTQLQHKFFADLDGVYDLILEDVEAMFEGDPAAKSKTEIIRSYPGFLAIAAYRIAHILYRNKIMLIPRMMTEYAHGMTGIDIHPGAQIGRRFCIDHGTGVVIGETALIGSGVKVYQGVTLGALSVDKEMADKKRHPTIHDEVVIYAGATILGGETEIGARSIIGGNVWLTKSIPADSKIYYQAKMHQENTNETDTFIVKSGS
ncbi:serine acetyltransferase [Litoribacter alkaliphilus]|uniref:Serine acetyltransferase n=1 Tax=Litoribacter ruber TaxID=702568 RepID=A0AAP2CG86_9BACT|nr:serine O-acetyltransferase EpsC [Litoribacter alkaliphilus]MBS9524058.1 serine acetyltransferase [Litoribacter alkaliphilus]